MKTTYLIPAALALGSLYSTSALAQPAAGPADEAVAAAPAAPTEAAPATMSPTEIVDHEFISYDLNKDGTLDETEFASWVTKLRKPAAAAPSEEDTQAWAASLFARADTDQDQAVSKTEMATLLSAARQG